MTSAPRALNIFGAQGSGKGTQAKALEKQFQAVHIGMGDTLRQMATEDTPEGREAKERTSAGQLISDDLANRIIDRTVRQLPSEQTFVIEGYPRTIVQADYYRALLEDLGRLTPKPAFIYLQAPEEELLKRLRKRRAVEERNDDSDELIRRRLALFDERTKPVIDHVADWADVIEIDGNQPIETVTSNIRDRLAHG